MNENKLKDPGFESQLVHGSWDVTGALSSGYTVVFTNLWVQPRTHKNDYVIMVIQASSNVLKIMFLVIQGSIYTLD